LCRCNLPWTGNAASPGLPALLAALKAELTIDNPKYQAAKQFGRWIGKQLKPKLFFFRQQDDGICFPRGFGNQGVRSAAG
jgi:hypothetical protein